MLKSYSNSLIHILTETDKQLYLERKIAHNYSSTMINVKAESHGAFPGISVSPSTN